MIEIEERSEERCISYYCWEYFYSLSHANAVSIEVSFSKLEIITSLQFVEDLKIFKFKI